MTAHWNCYRVE